MPRFDASQMNGLDDVIARCRELATCYQDASLCMRTRACGNFFTTLAERFEGLAGDLLAERQRLEEDVALEGPLPTCQHLFGWHLSEPARDRNEAMSQAIADAEMRLHGALRRLLAGAPPPPAILALLLRVDAAVTQGYERALVDRCQYEPPPAGERPQAGQSALG